MAALARDDWTLFAKELWGLTVVSWKPLPEREGKLPKPLEYDTLQDGLVELETGARHMVLQCLSCYQVGDSMHCIVYLILREWDNYMKTVRNAV
jgi:hypothetical protein